MKKNAAEQSVKGGTGYDDLGNISLENHKARFYIYIQNNKVDAEKGTIWLLISQLTLFTEIVDWVFYIR